MNRPGVTPAATEKMPFMAHLQSILLIDDNPGDVRLVREFLQERALKPVQVHSADRLSAGMAMLADLQPDIVLLDLSLPDSHGLDTLLALRKQAPEMPIVVLSGNESDEMALRVMEAGADDYLPKQDVDGVVLLRTIRHALARHQAERRLHLAEERNRLKSQFMAHISHEFRTPLNAILGFSQLLEFDQTIKASASTLRKVNTLRAAGEHLLSMVDDILDLSHIEAGEIALVLKPQDIDTLINECVGLIAPQAEARALKIDFTPQGASGIVLADRTRLRQVLLNLLSNAIKFNREHGIIEISRRPNGNMVELAVRDTGQGLSARQQQGLFEAFNRLGAEMSNTQGVGIGLTIVRQLVEKMRGTIRVESVPGEGSTFVVALPAA
jgi:signal transduction histidine kinase